MTEKELEELKRRARVAEERAQAERTLKRSDPYEARMQAAHENAAERHSAFVRSSPNSYAPAERDAAERHFARRREEEQRRIGISESAAERGTRERIGELEMIGKRDYGLAGERERAEAARYASDNTLKGIEAQARSEERRAQERYAAERAIKEREMSAQDRLSEREWNARRDIERDRAAAERERKEAEINGKREMEDRRQEGRARIEEEKAKREEMRMLYENGKLPDGYEMEKNGKRYRWNSKARTWIETLD